MSTSGSLEHLLCSMEKYWSHKHDFPIVEIWNTNTYIARYIAPRLRAFKALEKHVVPRYSNMNMRQWNSTIEKMVRAFDLYGQDGPLTQEEEEEKKAGFELFCKYFDDLWD